MVKKILWSSLAVICVLHFSCDDLSPASSNGDNSQYQYRSYEYSLSGDTVIADINMNYCDESTLIHIEYLKMAFFYSEDTLFLKNTNEAAVIMEDSSLLVLTRKGTGSGLIGTWIVIGTMATEESEMEPITTSGSTLTIIFTNTHMTSYTNKSFVDELFDSYTQGFADFEITVSKNGNTVVLLGNVTEEQVSITINSSGDQITYHSSNPQNDDHTYYSNPSECPNDVLPFWFIDFIYDNEELNKRRITSQSELAIQLKRSIRRLIYQ